MTEQLAQRSHICPARFRILRWIRRSAAVFLLFGSMVVFGGFLFFADHVAHLHAPARLSGADGIVVVTGGQSRIDTALELLREGRAKRLLISGVHPQARIDDLQQASRSDKAIFTCCVDIDRLALNTVGNAKESAKWVLGNTYHRIIVVTNNYHMPRTLLEMHRYLPAAELVPYPVVNTSLDDGAWIAKPDALRVLFTEYVKYVAALARGILSLQDSMEAKDSSQALAHK